MEDAVELRRKIALAYERDPEGWRVQVTRDIQGHHTTLFQQRRHIWLLKEEPINPFRAVGVGLTTTLEEGPKLAELPSFGFRPLPRAVLKALLKAPNPERGIEHLLRSVMAQPPQPLRTLRGPMALQGPVTFTREPSDIFPGQRELEARLRGELESLLHRKYPHLSSIYG